MKGGDFLALAVLLGGGYFAYRLYQQSTYSSQIRQKQDVMAGAILAGKPLSPVQISTLYGGPSAAPVSAGPIALPDSIPLISTEGV